jgi:hypothetical protein
MHRFVVRVVRETATFTTRVANECAEISQNGAVEVVAQRLRL